MLRRRMGGTRTRLMAYATPATMYGTLCEWSHDFPVLARLLPPAGSNPQRYRGPRGWGWGYSTSLLCCEGHVVLRGSDDEMSSPSMVACRVMQNSLVSTTCHHRFVLC